MIGARLPFDAREIPVSVLAYIGDAVYELYVRLHVAQVACGGSGDLHRKSISFVSARSQADAMRRLLPLLTEAEAAVYRRSRNHQSGSLPKNADPVTYRIATGFEGLIGYLYVNGQQARLDELMQVALHPGDAVDAPVGDPLSMGESGLADTPAGGPIACKPIMGEAVASGLVTGETVASEPFNGELVTGELVSMKPFATEPVAREEERNHEAR